MTLLLGIDQGTSGTRAIVYDSRLRPVAEAYARVTPTYPASGMVEQDPGQLLESVVESATRAVRAAGAARVDAVGLANQGETVVAWNQRSGQPLAPAISWQDKRTEPFLEQLRAGGRAELVQRVSGMPLDPYFSASKLRWLLEQPDVQQARGSGSLRIGTTDAYLRERLTGHYETDPATASRTQLLDMKTLTWEPSLCEAFEVACELLPAVAPTTGRLGELSHGELCASLVDQQAALAGHGCFAIGDAKATYGTGCFFLQNQGTQLPPASSGLVPTVAWQLADSPTYALEGGVLSASSALVWLATVGVLSRPEDAETQAAQVQDSGGVVFVPALTGLGAPWWRSDARGVLTGISHATSKGHIVRAVLEGIALRVRDIVEAAAAATGSRLSSLSVDGGMTASRTLLQAQADVLGIPIEVRRDHEATALGAAALAGLQTGVFGTPAEIGSALPEAKVVTPLWSEDQRELVYSRWRELLACDGAT